MSNPFVQRVIQVPGQESRSASPSVSVDKFSRVLTPALERTAQNPALESFEKLFRTTPDDAWYDVSRSPSNPTQFEIGTFLVPQSRCIIITNFSFEAYKFSGVGAYASEPLDRSELNGIIAYRFDVSGKVPGSVDYEINPSVSTGRRRKFSGDPTKLIPPNQRTAQDFQRVASNAFGSASGFGTGIMPPRLGRFGDQNKPYACKANTSEQITMTGVVLRPMPVPLAFIEGVMQGYIGPQDLIDTMWKDLQRQV
jgi:hypothetical protein